MISNYEIGGNEVKPGVSEAIAAIPENKTLIIEKLTDEEPVNPEVVKGLATIEQIFAHYKPEKEIEFENADGEPVSEKFHFGNIGDFSVRNMTEQSRFLKKVSTEKNFYENLVKQLRSNKVLQRALENPESKAAMLEALETILAELKQAE